jgi:hypothetical protein
VTVSTSGYAAGTVVENSCPLLPAATTYVTPAEVERQIARFRASPSRLPHNPSAKPNPARLMFATLMFSELAFWVTQSMPQTTCDHVPCPDAFRTFTA